MKMYVQLMKTREIFSKFKSTSLAQRLTYTEIKFFWICELELLKLHVGGGTSLSLIGNVLRNERDFLDNWNIITLYVLKFGFDVTFGFSTLHNLLGTIFSSNSPAKSGKKIVIGGSNLELEGFYLDLLRSKKSRNSGSTSSFDL